MPEDKSFLTVLKHYQSFNFNGYLKNTSTQAVGAILAKDVLSPVDFLQLLSVRAEPHLEEMARKSHELTIQHFGKTIGLYTPLYLSNYCINSCKYCGFNKNTPITRRKLTFKEVQKEALAIHAAGHRQILILSGEDRSKCDVDYIGSCVKILRKYFSSIAVEIFPLKQAEYKYLGELGVDNLTIYQETYNRTLYKELHPAGPKGNFESRLETPEHALNANIRSVNIGALLGLDDWRKEIFFTGLHAWYLQKKYPFAELSVSLPRMQNHAGDFSLRVEVPDKGMVQAITAFRLFMPRLGISISTRESAQMRENVLPLGVTRMSAGSKTTVGGYSDSKSEDRQFSINDRRSVKEIEQWLYAKGYQPVYKDWHILV